MDAKKLVDFMVAEANFVIPLYQRRYAWQAKHCRRLFSDLMRILQNNIPTHFIGSIVTRTEDERGNNIIIIDGQQRLTTVSLIILAAYNAYKNGLIKSAEDEDDVKYNVNRLLGRKSHKLIPIEEDRIAYDKLFTNDEEAFKQGCGMTTNYQLFYRSIIERGDLTIDDILKAINALRFIPIELSSGDNPQLIFESLNSCGKDLEESDKVRNYLLMNLSQEDQNEYYRNYWHEIERCFDFNESKLSSFIRDYMTVQLRAIANEKELYFVFKDYCERENRSNREMLEDMLKFARIAQKVQNANWGEKAIDRVLRGLAILNYKITMPFFLAFLRYAQLNNISSEEIKEVLSTIESFLARRIFAGKPTNSLNKIFAALHNEVKRGLGKEENALFNYSYSQLLKSALLKKEGLAAFPTDEEVIEGVAQKNIYDLNTDTRYFLFDRLEAGVTLEGTTDTVEKMKNGDLSIEHIMPQHPSKEWKEELGISHGNPELEEEYNKYLHTLANLTLTAYNSEYSNRPFQAKKQGFLTKKGHAYGFDDSPIQLSKYMKTVDKWTLTELEERKKQMQELVLRLWPMIETQCPTPVEDAQVFNFSDDPQTLTGRKPISFSFRSNRVPVDNWKEFLVQVCKEVDKINPEAIPSLAANNHVFYNYKVNNNYDEVAMNCYVPNNTSIETKCNVILNLFQAATLPLGDLEVELQPKDNDSN